MATEHEITVAVDAASRHLWENVAHGTYPSRKVQQTAFDDLEPLHKQALRENVMRLAIAVLEAVEPVMKQVAWNEGWLAYHEDVPQTENPYPETIA